VIFGGLKKITKVATTVVPFMVVVYFGYFGIKKLLRVGINS
jgi:Na+/alanine symporter